MISLFIMLLNVITDVKKLDSLYEYRHTNSTYLKTVKSDLEYMYGQKMELKKVIWRLARVYFTYGDNAKSKEKKLYWYTKGKAKAKEAMTKFPELPGGHFWYAVNLGRIGQVKGVLNSLGLAPTIRKEFEKTLKIDPNHTGALDGLGVYYYAIPSYVGGSLSKSLNYLNKAIEIDPHYSVAYIDLAKVYIKKKKYDKARYYLYKVINMKNPTHPADYYLDDKPDAEKLLEKIKNK